MDANDTNKKNKELHHANLIIGQRDCKDFVVGILEERLNFKIQANPDFLLIESASFGIDDSRNLERWAMGKPLAGEAKASLIAAKSMTFEAQNALLKVLEEPPLGTYFFICLQSLGGLLPTFLSRVRIIHLEEDADAKKSSAAKFLEADVKGRFALVRSASKKEDKNQLLELLGGLEEAVYEKYKAAPKYDEQKAQALKDVLAAKTFASARGSSLKMILEWLACVL